LNPLSGIYAAVVGARNALYDRALLPVRHLQGPVVSVGNLSAGGSGKTPFVMLLGELLKTRGVTFDVLSRGYGRKTRGVLLVDPGGLPAQFGDEPLLIARKLQVPVIVGEDRYEAGRFAESRFGPQLHLLDDGFQHRALARDFDIVLITPQDANDRLLPAGRLREPFSSLRRADVVALTGGAMPDSFSLADKPLWRVRRGIIPQNIPSRPVVFCGIARPQNFLLQLHAANIDPVAEAFYSDHHAYTEKDVKELLALHRPAVRG
jgi:tetraacyldisaccharide 4'-kinase